MYDDYDEIRKNAEERVKKRESAREGLIAYCLIVGFLWIAWLAALFLGVRENVLTPTFFTLMPLTLIWGFIAIGTWYDDVYAIERREERFQQEVEKEIERELAKRALTEKRKRLGLSDDGELVEMDYEPVENGYNEIGKQ